MREVEVSLRARVSLAHACVQVLADRCGADLLHIKGPTLDPSLRDDLRGDGTDADVVVRPAHVDRLIEALTAHGWRRVTGFDNGSVFAHAANYRHRSFGYVDVHRSVPGITIEPAAAFESLWADRGSRSIAATTCQVPSLLDQSLVLLLHAARGQGSSAAVMDREAVWDRGDHERRQALRERARRLSATVAMAAVLGELDQHPPDRTTALWRVQSEGGTRLEEYLATIRAAPDRRTRLQVAVRGARLDQEYVAMALGHSPSPSELRRLRVERWGHALAALWSWLRAGPRRQRRPRGGS